MKFALVSTHNAHGVKLRINPEQGDGTSFINWVSVLDGFHFQFEALRTEGYEALKAFDVVMMSGHPSYMQDIIDISKALKDTQAVTVFFPEGSTQLYDSSIRNFQPKYYEAWNACDIMGIVEEDKVSYYRSFLSRDTLVKFIHVPLTRDMESGSFLIPRRNKNRSVVVYGDNNPNHPLIAFACARAFGAEPIIGVEISRENAEEIEKILPGIKIIYSGKMPHNSYLRTLGRSFVHFYPTEWIGTAREQISCASVGTPCIGNHDSHTQRRLFPELGCDIYDIDRMSQLAQRLSSDEEFYNGIVRRAFDASQFYNLDNSKRRFFQAWDEATAIKRARVRA